MGHSVCVPQLNCNSNVIDIPPLIIVLLIKLSYPRKNAGGDNDAVENRRLCYKHVWITWKFHVDGLERFSCSTVLRYIFVLFIILKSLYILLSKLHHFDLKMSEIYR